MQKRHLILLAIFLILSVALFLSREFPPIKFVAGIVQNAFAVPKGFIYSLRTGNTDSADMKKIKDENEALTAKLIDYERTKRDNEALKSQFESTTTSQYNLIPARVLGYAGASSAPNVLVIDRGEHDGVKKGAAVVLQNNLLGKIGKVSSAYSEVILLLNPSFVTLSKTSDSGARGVARGNNDFILLDRVTVDDKVEPGSMLLTAGDVDSRGVGIPPDFVIGNIVSVNHNPSLPFQTAKIESNVKFDRLDTVFVFNQLK